MSSSPYMHRGASGSIGYLESGGDRAAPLVLLHGIGSNANSFAPLMAALPADLKTLAWDAPGYGSSAPLTLEWPSADDYVAALDAFLDRLGIARLHLLGHSMGALIAGRFAVRHADRLASLTLASPALGYGTAPGATLAAPAANRLEAMIAEGAPQFAATRGPRLVWNNTMRPHVVADVIAAMSEVRLPGYRHSSRMLSCADLVADAAHIRTPTVVLVGDKDEITPPENCRRVYDALIAATPALAHRFELVSDCGHAVVQENPKAVAELMERLALARGS